MKAVLLAVAALAGWLVWRRRREARPRAHVAWRDGAELELRGGSREHARLVGLAGRVLA